MRLSRARRYTSVSTMLSFVNGVSDMLKGTRRRLRLTGSPTEPLNQPITCPLQRFSARKAWQATICQSQRFRIYHLGSTDYGDRIRDVSTQAVSDAQSHRQSETVHGRLVQRVIQSEFSVSCIEFSLQSLTLRLLKCSYPVQIMMST